MTKAKLELARIADQDGIPSKELRITNAETPAAYWNGKSEFVPPALKKINQDLTENLEALENPAKFDQLPLKDRIETFEKLSRNYAESPSRSRTWL